MSKISGCHHVAIRTADIRKSVAFYTEVLGLTLKATFVADQGRPGALIEIASASYVEIFERAPELPAGKPIIFHFCFRTDDVEGMVERVRAAGFPVAVEPEDYVIDTEIGTLRARLAFVTGPDGESIELMRSENW